MERIEIYTRTTREKGAVKLRFRLNDGRNVQLFHKSDIKADISDLVKIGKDGDYIPGIRKRSVELTRLHDDIEKEMSAMSIAYGNMKRDGMEICSEVFEREIQAVLHPEKEEVETQKETLVSRLEMFVRDSVRQGLWGPSRFSLYKLVCKEMERFLVIHHKAGITPSEFTPNDVMDFRQFVIDEYRYVERYKRLYKDENARNIPKEPRNQNTTATRMKQLKAFFACLEDNDEIPKSPFRKLGKERTKIATKERYDEPVFLRFDEFKKLMDAEIPENLRETRDAFVLQCAFGCRIADFQKLTMEKVAVDPNGIPYIHYIPNKTKKEQRDNSEIETPILRYALDIIKQYGFKFKILKYVSGEWGYNAKIKQLLKHCEINRKCKVFNEDMQDNEYLPLHELGSSKLARKTHVDIMNKAQVNMYAAGLHKVGSDAVNRYTTMEIADRFKLMCYAFGQKEYRVDEQLNVVKKTHGSSRKRVSE